MGFCVDLIKLKNLEEFKKSTNSPFVDFYNENGCIKYSNFYLGGDEVVNSKNIDWEEYDKKNGIFTLKDVIKKNLLTKKGLENLKKGLEEFKQEIESAIYDIWVVDFGY